MTTTIRTGLVPNLPADEYHAGTEVSNSMLTAMHKSAAHCYALHIDPARPAVSPTPAMLGGTLAHSYILEPDDFGLRYVVKPDGIDYRTNAGKAWRDEQTATIITADDMARAQQQRAAVHKVQALRNLLSKGTAEASVFWTDAATGLRCRARPDWLHWHGPRRATVLDLKTISDLTADAVQRAVASYGYHRQAAHYSAGLRAVGVEVEEFVFGFVSSSYPYLAAAYVLDDETIDQGREEVEDLLHQFADCQKRGEWPAFGDGYQATGLPAWAKRSSEVEVGWA